MDTRQTRRWLSLALVVVLGTSCGLEKLGERFTDSTTQTVAILDKAIDDLGGESSNWRQIVEKALHDLPDQASSLVRNELSDTLNRGIATAGVETRCTIDFIGNRVRQQLIKLRATLLGTDAPAPEPAICDVVPLVIDMNLSPEKRNVLEFFGYDFDRTAIQVTHVAKSGASTDITSLLTRPSRYVMTLNLSNNAITDQSRRLALSWNGEEISTIGVLQKNMPVCDTRSESAQLSSITYRPPLVRGDGEFNGRGPDISVSIKVRIRTDVVGTRRDSKIVASYSMTAVEVEQPVPLNGDHSTLSGSGESVLWTAPTGFMIDGLPGETTFSFSFRSTSHDADRRQNALVEVLTTGDTDGIDKDKTGMEMLFKPQTVILRQDTDCVSANALIRADANRQLSPAAAALLQQKLNTLSPALRGDLERLPRAPLPRP